MSRSDQRLLWRFFSVLPVVLATAVAVFIGSHEDRELRKSAALEAAQNAALMMDLRLEELLNLARYCVASISLREELDLNALNSHCGRYAELSDAWVIIVETGPIHKHLMNTLLETTSNLPEYPRSNEFEQLLRLQEITKQTKQPRLADAFRGKINSRGVVAAGQALSLPDGWTGMLYIGTYAETISQSLEKLAYASGKIFTLIDPSGRVVARSSEAERYLFMPVPNWMDEPLQAGRQGAELNRPGLEKNGGQWDVGYFPVSVSQGWMLAAVSAADRGIAWPLMSAQTLIVCFGIAWSLLAIWITGLLASSLQRLDVANMEKSLARRESQAKSRILATAAHDLRAPLIAIIGGLEEAGSAREPRHFVETSLRSAKELQKLLDDILELSFLASPNTSIHVKPVDLRALAKELVRNYKAAADRKRISLSAEVDNYVPPLVMVDRSRIYQVLSNLISNGIKFTEAGQVRLVICVGEETSAHVNLTFEVLDTGLGISREKIPVILREFGRLDRDIERREEGYGLGLAICRRILQKMDSDLHVSSAEDAGSAFSFKIKAQVADVEEPSPVTSRPLQGATILYAEDEPITRFVVGKKLTEAGAQVVSVEDGSQALKVIPKKSPDIVLVDMRLPDMTGVDVVHALFERFPKISTFNCIISAHVSEHLEESARKGGANLVVAKPLDVDVLARSYMEWKSGTD